MTPIGVDKLVLNLSDYRFDPPTFSRICAGYIDPMTGETNAVPLWVDGQGSHYGSSALLEHPARVFQMMVQPSPSDKNHIYAHCQFSPGNVLGSNNYEPASESGVREALSIVERELAEFGIHANLKNGSLSRVDITRNVHIDSPYESYVPVLEAIETPSRHKLRRDDDTFYWGNKSHQITTYDKINEMKSTGKSFAGIPKTARFEHRLLRSAKCKSFLGMKTVSEMLGDFNVLESSYRKHLANTIFSGKVPEVATISQEQLVNELNFFKERGDRYPIESWHLVNSIANIADTEVFLRAVAEVSDNPSLASRKRKQLRQAKNDLKALRPIMVNRRSSGDMYTELQEKILA